MLDDNNLYGRAVGLNERGRHKTIASAFQAAYNDLSANHNAFFDSLVDNWRRLFPSMTAARPGRFENGRIYIYVRNSAAAFAVRPKLRQIAERLATIPGAPSKIDLRLEQHVL